MRIQGTIDRCEPGALTGWIIDHDQPGQRVTMQVVCAGTVLGNCVADRFRADLASAGLGDGHHSFEFELPLNLPPAGLRAVRLRLSDSHAYLLQDAAQVEDSEVEPVFTNLSRFGGLWLDRMEWLDRMGALTRSGAMDEALAGQLMRFARDGYLHLPAAIAPAAADLIANQIDTLWAIPPPGLTALRLLEDLTEQPTAPGPEARAAGDGLAEVHAMLPDLRAALAAPALLGFLTALFADTPKIFASRALADAPPRPLVKDLALIPIAANPLAMAGLFLALDDVTAETGGPELMAGSHRAPDFPFAPRSPWLKDAPEQRRAWLAHLRHEARVHGFTALRPALAKGDMLVWHPNLSHGLQPGEGGRVQARLLLLHAMPSLLAPPFAPAQDLPPGAGLHFTTPATVVAAEAVAVEAAAVEAAAAEAPASPAAEEDGWDLVLLPDSAGRAPVQPAGTAAPASADSVADGDSPMPER